VSFSSEGRSVDTLPDLQQLFKQALFWTNMVLLLTEHRGQVLYLLSVVGLRPSEYTFMVPSFPVRKFWCIHSFLGSL